MATVSRHFLHQRLPTDTALPLIYSIQDNVLWVSKPQTPCKSGTWQLATQKIFFLKSIVEFISIKPSAAMGSGAPGNYGGHNRVP